MTERSREVIDIARAEQALRQEQAAFEQRLYQDAQWLRLKLTVGYSSVGLIAIIMVVCSCILFEHALFPDPIIVSAGATLFGDLISLGVAVWKIVLNRDTFAFTNPVTTTSELAARNPTARAKARVAGSTESP
jgi:hypothetical protein